MDWDHSGLARRARVNMPVPEPILCEHDKYGKLYRWLHARILTQQC